MRLVILLFVAVCGVASAATFDEVFRSGLVALQRGDLAGAEAGLQEALRMQPGNGRVWVALAQTYRKLGAGVKADEAAGKARALGADDAVVMRSLAIYNSEAAQGYFERAQPLLEKERFAEAIAVLRDGVAAVGKDAQLELALGVAYYGQRRFAEAADAFFAVIAVDPGAKQAYVFLGKMLDVIPDRLVEATERFAAFERANPGDADGYLLHAKALDARGVEAGVARGLLERAIGLNGGDASAHAELGGLLERQHEFVGAAVEFERAAVLEPSDAVTHYRLSRIYERLQRPEAAAAEREKHRALVAARDTAR